MVTGLNSARALGFTVSSQQHGTIAGPQHTRRRIPYRTPQSAQEGTHAALSHSGSFSSVRSAAAVCCGATRRQAPGVLLLLAPTQPPLRRMDSRGGVATRASDDFRGPAPHIGDSGDDGSGGDWDDDGEDIPVVLPLSPPPQMQPPQPPPASPPAGGASAQAHAAPSSSAADAEGAQHQQTSDLGLSGAEQPQGEVEEAVQSSWWDAGAAETVPSPPPPSGAAPASGAAADEAQRRQQRQAMEDLAAEADYLIPTGGLFDGAAAAAADASAALHAPWFGGSDPDDTSAGHGPLSAPPSVFSRLLAACDALSRTELDLRAAEALLPSVSAALDLADTRVEAVAAALKPEAWPKGDHWPRHRRQASGGADEQLQQGHSSGSSVSSGAAAVGGGGGGGGEAAAGDWQLEEEGHPQGPLLRALSKWIAGAIRAAARHAIEALGWLSSTGSPEQRKTGDPEPLLKELEDRFRNASKGPGETPRDSGSGGSSGASRPPSQPAPPGEERKQGPSVPRFQQPGAGPPPPPQGPAGFFPPLGSPPPPFGPGMVPGTAAGGGQKKSGRGGAAGRRTGGGFFPEHPSADQSDAVIIAFCRRESRWLAERAQRHLRVLLPRLRRTMHRQAEEVRSMRAKKTRLAALVDEASASSYEEEQARAAAAASAASSGEERSSSAAGGAAVRACMERLRSAAASACLALERANDAVDEQLRVLEAACASCERSSRAALVALDAAAPLFRRWEQVERIHHAVDAAAAAARLKMAAWEHPHNPAASSAAEFSLEALLEFAFTHGKAEADPFYLRVVAKLPGATHEDVRAALRNLVGRSQSGRIIFVQEMLAVPPPMPPQNSLRSILRDGQEELLGRRAFESELEWAVFQALCAEASVRPPLSLHELMPAAGMFVERPTS